MTLLRYPHFVTIMQTSQAKDGTTKVVEVPTFAGSGTVKCQVTPEKAGRRIDAKTGDLLSRPHVLMCDVSDAGKFVYNYRVTLGSRVFRVAASPETFDMEDPTDHSSIALEELNFAA